jgi:hypothetical protein
MHRFQDWRVGLEHLRPSYFKNPWIILGKGPTSDRLAEVNLALFNVLTLNDAVKLVPSCDIAHAIDFEVVARAGRLMRERARWVLMPERPHVGCHQGPPIATYLTEKAPRTELPAMEKAGQLVAYRKWPWDVSEAPPDSVTVRYFSAEAAVSILGLLGIRDVLLVGVDGGTTYGKAFEGLKPGENGRPDFSVQFDRIRQLAAFYEMNVRPYFKEQINAPRG